jgi:hypothetical protein
LAFVGIFFLYSLIISFLIFQGIIKSKSNLYFFIFFGLIIGIWEPGRYLPIFNFDWSNIFSTKFLFILAKLRKVFPFAAAPYANIFLCLFFSKNFKNLFLLLLV